MSDRFFGFRAVGSQWSISLLHFSMVGDMASDLFVLTTSDTVTNSSQVYYFFPTAHRAFISFISKKKENGEQFDLESIRF